jgi:hypothetical protein
MMSVECWKEGEHRSSAEDFRKGMCYYRDNDKSEEELCKTVMYVLIGGTSQFSYEYNRRKQIDDEDIAKVPQRKKEKNDNSGDTLKYAR